MNSITDIKNLIDSAGGIQRSNRFNVILNTPDGINTIPALKVAFGGRQLDTIADKLPGPGFGRNIPFTQNYSNYGSNSSNLLITFPIEQNWNTYKLLENWMKVIVNDGSIPGSGYGVSFARPYDDWIREGFVRVECLDMNGTIKSTFIFREAFPIKLQPIELRADIGDFASFEVFYSFRNYEVV
jgi:hypothetical protein